MSASGSFTPQMSVQQWQKLNNKMKRRGPAETSYQSSKVGWINEELFLRWLKHCVTHSRPTLENPVLLVLGNHSSHILLESYALYKENNHAIATATYLTANAALACLLLWSYTRHVACDWEITPTKKLLLIDIVDFSTLCSWTLQVLRWPAHRADEHAFSIYMYHPHNTHPDGYKNKTHKNQYLKTYKPSIIFKTKHITHTPKLLRRVTCAIGLRGEQGMIVINF